VRLISWNVQWCCGLDGVVDPARIASEMRRLADPDIACLQEIASDFPELTGSKGEDQPVALWREMPDHEPVVGWAVDIAGRRARAKPLAALACGAGRIVSTHLEYYSATHRAAHVGRLRELHGEWLAEHKHEEEWGPFRSQPSLRGAIVCGDFNLPPEDPLHQAILDIGFVDAWQPSAAISCS
jgi:endonuclease/exonuclease/phosphatase family metal-dependent hydrolase